MFLLYNQNLFDSNYYDEESIVKSAKTDWIAVNTQFQ